MNILVCISCVHDTTSKINISPDRKYIDSSNTQWIINPIDEYVLAKAILLQKEIGANITTISIGSSEIDGLLRKTLAIGADKAIRINALHNDNLNIAKEISYFIQDNNFDLILTGKESIDYNDGTTPALIAQLLNIPFVNSCIHLEINNKEVLFTRKNSTKKETFSTNLPLVVAGEKGIVTEKDLIIPNMRSMINAKNKPLIIKEPKKNLTETNIYFEKGIERKKVKFISSNNLDELIDILHKEQKIL